MCSSKICVFRLKPLDVSFMKAIHHKVNIVPVIAKADTLTKVEVVKLKRKVLKTGQYKLKLESKSNVFVILLGLILSFNLL